MHATLPEGSGTVEASQPPCAKSPTDSLGLTEPKSYLPMPPHGPTPIPARPVPAVQARKESRPLVLDEDGFQHLEPPKAKPRGPSEPSGTRDPSAPACAPVGYGFLTTAQYIADLFSTVSDLPSVINASFPAMLSYADPDYWLGALLLAFESHQKGPLERTAGLPIVLGFPESDNKITDLQINVPPAAMVAFLAGRAYRCPKCPTTKYVMDAHSGLPQVTGQASQEALQAWAAAAQHTDVEKARLAQPNLNTFLGITLQGTETLGQRHYQEFRPDHPPAHFLDAIRLALAASVANQNIEHFWSVYNLEWPDTSHRMAVFLRRVLPLECLLSSPMAAPVEVNTAAASPAVVSISFETNEGSPCPMDDMSDAEDEPEAQVNDWRFSELRTTDLAALREVDVSAPFRLPVIFEAHWKGISAPHPPSMGQNVPEMSGMMQPLLTGLPLRGSCELSIQPSSDSTASGLRCTAMAPPRTLILRPYVRQLHPSPFSIRTKVLCSTGKSRKLSG